jgi:DNA-directed RNA polymerase specialized sigma24 family protein
MAGDQPTSTLITRAAGGDRHAWDTLVELYAPLVWSICRDQPDAADIGLAVWLQLADQVRTLRDPAALTRWLVITTQRECNRLSLPS